MGIRSRNDLVTARLHPDAVGVTVERSTSRRGVARAVVLLAVGVPGVVGAAVLLDAGTSDIAFLVASAAFLVVGAMVLAKAGGNRVGLVLGLVGVALTGSGISEALADDGWLIGHAIGGALWLSWFILAGFLFLWFPTGRPPSRRWTAVEWVGYVGLILVSTYLIAEQLCLEGQSGECSVWVDNPIGITGVPNPEYGRFSSAGYLVIIFFALASFASLAVRYFRSRGQERLQLKWFIFSVASLISVMVIDESGLLPAAVFAGDALFGAVIAALPISIGLAVLRFRLYDIERIISRTVGYVLVVGLLVPVYGVVAVWLPARLIGSQPPVFVAGATLAVAALFNPVRRRVLHAVDRRFFRTRYDAEAISHDFAARLRSEVDPDQVMADWLGVVAGAVRPAAAGFWLRGDQ